MLAYKRALALFLALLLCAAPHTAAQAAQDYTGAVILLYTGGLRGDMEGPGSYAALKSLKEEYEAMGATVLAFSLGDDFSAPSEGTADDAARLALMNECGYTAMAPGEADFARGVDTLKALEREARFDFLSCNFTTDAGQPVFLPCALYGSIGVLAFSGPGAAAGMKESERQSYDFNGEVARLLIEETAAKLRDEGARQVVLLAHCGTGEESRPWRVEDLLLQCSGVDIWIEAHGDSRADGYGEDAAGERVMRLFADPAYVGGVYLRGGDGMPFSTGEEEEAQSLPDLFMQTQRGAAAAAEQDGEAEAALEAARRAQASAQGAANNYPAPNAVNTGAASAALPLGVSALSLFLCALRVRKKRNGARQA